MKAILVISDISVKIFDTSDLVAFESPTCTPVSSSGNSISSTRKVRDQKGTSQQEIKC